MSSSAASFDPATLGELERVHGVKSVARVLVVEDEDLLRRILMMNLVHHGYSVSEAESVAEACEAIESAGTIGTPFDVILLDLNLPDRTGWDVLRWLKAHANDRSLPVRPKVIVMTAVHPAQCRLEEFRPDVLLLKPFPMDALLRSVERVLLPAPNTQDEQEALEVSDG